MDAHLGHFIAIAQIHTSIMQRQIIDAVNIISMGADFQTDSIISQKLILELFTYLLNQR
ncbi:MAG TPA: hypothetical protein V6D25_07555 [Leptolyngbyaceae cyanobacterium]